MEQVMDMMIKYLPDDLLQELKSSQTALEAAKDEYERIKNDPNATEEQKAKAEAELKKAREAVKKAYSDAGSYWKDALVKFVNIVWETLKELKRDIVTETPIAIENFNNQQLIVKNKVNPDILNSSKQDKEEEFSYEIFENIESAPNQNLASFAQDVFTLEQKRKSVYFIRATLMLVAYYTTIVVVESDFKNDTILDGKELIEFILQELKERKMEVIIIQNLKQKIRTKLEDFGEFLHTEENKD
jgi:hypothetical protein